MFLHPVDAGRRVLRRFFHQLLQARGFDLHVANLSRGTMRFFGDGLQDAEAVCRWARIELSRELLSHHIR